MRINLPVTDREFVLAEGEQIVSRTDLDSYITYVNDGFVRASGYDRAELVGQPQNVVRHPDVPEAVFADLWRTLKQGKPWSGVIKNRRKDGGFYWVRANVAPLLTGSRVSGYMSVRTRPSQDEVTQAVALYRELARGPLARVRLEAGRVHALGVRGLWQRLLGVSFRARAWATAVVLCALFAVVALVGAGVEGAASRVLVVVGCVGMIGAWSFGTWCSRALAGPLIEATAVARRVVGGDVAAEFPHAGDPHLIEFFGLLNQMKANVFGVLQDVHERAHRVDAAARGIASGNADLSVRTEQQATSLEETASSMEQLTAAVRQNAGHAEQANQLAQGASEVARRGGAVVAQVVETMSSINESSSRITDIVGLIDSIAFQTNLLALNAAVEAARAGEQGRGFAVVASEVQHLAQRSASAADEIKGLLEDSEARVEAGSRLVGQAGQTMDEIMAAVARVTQIMREIAEGSREQSAGIEQVNGAVTLMDQVTQQNAALVEQLAGSARQLGVQTYAVHDAMAMFDLGGQTSYRNR